MQYGMWISASAASTQMHRQNVFSNNLANIDTVGFKHDAVSTAARDAVRVAALEAGDRPLMLSLDLGHMNRNNGRR